MADPSTRYEVALALDKSPLDHTAKLLFMTTNSRLSRIIRFFEKGAVSHVCSILEDGSVVSSDLGFGIIHEPSAAAALVGASMQITVDVPMNKTMYDDWQDYLLGRVGEPFDLKGTLGMALPFDFHQNGAHFCASITAGALRHCRRFPHELSLKFHRITPVVLLMIMQSQPLGSVIIHDPVNLEKRN